MNVFGRVRVFDWVLFCGITTRTIRCSRKEGGLRGCRQRAEATKSKSRISQGEGPWRAPGIQGGISYTDALINAYSPAAGRLISQQLSHLASLLSHETCGKEASEPGTRVLVTVKARMWFVFCWLSEVAKGGGAGERGDEGGAGLIRGVIGPFDMKFGRPSPGRHRI